MDPTVSAVPSSLPAQYSPVITDTTAQGTTLASNRLGMRLLVLPCLLLMSCIVTDKIDLPEEDSFPPSITSCPESGTTSIDQIITLNVDEERRAGNEELVFQVCIQDANLDQDLELLTYVDSNPELTVLPTTDQEVLANGMFQRQAEVRVPFERLGTPGECHRVEMRVSGGFIRRLDEFGRPVDALDLGQAFWFVALANDTSEATCP